MIAILAIVAVAFACLCLWRLFARHLRKNSEREKPCVVSPAPVHALQFCKENGQCWIMPYSRLMAACYHRADVKGGDANSAIGVAEEIQLSYLTREISIRGLNLDSLMEWIRQNRAVKIRETPRVVFPSKETSGPVVTGIEVGAEAGTVNGAAP